MAVQWLAADLSLNLVADWDLSMSARSVCVGSLGVLRVSPTSPTTRRLGWLF